MGCVLLELQFEEITMKRYSLWPSTSSYLLPVLSMNEPYHALPNCQALPVLRPRLTSHGSALTLHDEIGECFLATCTSPHPLLTVFESDALGGRKGQYGSITDLVSKYEKVHLVGTRIHVTVWYLNGIKDEQYHIMGNIH